MATGRKKLETNERYLAKLERITIRVHKDGSDGFTRGQLEATAQAAGQSVNAWIVEVIRRELYGG